MKKLFQLNQSKSSFLKATCLITVLFFIVTIFTPLYDVSDFVCNMFSRDSVPQNENTFQGTFLMPFYCCFITFMLITVPLLFIATNPHHSPLLLFLHQCIRIIHPFFQ